MFEKCTFKYVFPCLNRIDFNAYSPFNIVFSDCKFFIDNSNYALVNLLDIDEIQNPRNELFQKCLPNIVIKDCSFVINSNVKYLYIFYVGGYRYSKPLSYISSLTLKDINVSGADVPLKISNTYITTENKIISVFKNISYEGLQPNANYRFVNVSMLNKNEDSKLSIIGHNYIR